MLLPRDVDHHPEPLPAGGVEQPPGRDRVRADGVQPAGGDLAEIALDRVRPPVLAPGRVVGPERPVRDAAHPQLRGARVHELAEHPRPAVPDPAPGASDRGVPGGRDQVEGGDLPDETRKLGHETDRERETVAGAILLPSRRERGSTGRGPTGHPDSNFVPGAVARGGSVG